MTKPPQDKSAQDKPPHNKTSQNKPASKKPSASAQPSARSAVQPVVQRTNAHEGAGHTPIPLPGFQGTQLPTLLMKMRQQHKDGTLPRATWVYCIAAAGFFVFAVTNLFQGAWFTAFFLFVIALTLVAFGLFYLRNPDA